MLLGQDATEEKKGQGLDIPSTDYRKKDVTAFKNSGTSFQDSILIIFAYRTTPTKSLLRIRISYNCKKSTWLHLKGPWFPFCITFKFAALPLPLATNVL